MIPAGIRIGCKVNLSLAITGRLPNGYHTLSSVFMPVPEPHDVLHIADAPPGSGLTLSCDAPGIDPSENTLTRAYACFAEAAGTAPDLTLRLEKGIPPEAGLGGGSADAAALLARLDAMTGHSLTAERLSAVALRVGADVPFFLLNRPCLADGVGERLTPRPDVAAAMAGLTVLVCCPSVRVSTAWAYHAWDDRPVPPTGKAAPPPDGSSDDLTNPTATDTGYLPYADGVQGRRLPFDVRNDFESVVFPHFPELAELKRRLYAGGAAHAVMSGSGSSIVGIFACRTSAVDIAEGLAGDGIDSYVNTVA